MLDVSVIRAEREELERELRADPRHLKVQKLLELEALYAKESGAVAAARAPLVTLKAEAPEETVKSWPSQGAFHSRGTGKVKRRIDPGRLQVLEQAANVIRGRGAPTKTANIYLAFAAEDRALIKGDSPQGNLSAMLHHSPHFFSHGRLGWTLTDPTSAPEDAVSGGLSAVGVADELEEEAEREKLFS